MSFFSKEDKKSKDSKALKKDDLKPLAENNEVDNHKGKGDSDPKAAKKPFNPFAGMDFLNDPDAEFTLERNQKEVSRAIKSPVKGGMIVGLFVLLFFGLWAGLAPLDSAAIATGSIVLHENRKTVQHLEGGIINKILVQEGDSVEKGQELLLLNATSASAQQKLLLGQLKLALATESRLIAERDGRKKIDFSAVDTMESGDGDKKTIIAGQKKLFDTRRSSLFGQINVLKERKAQYRNQISGLKSQIEQIVIQNKLIDEEVRTVSILLSKGLEQKPRLLALQRKNSELKAQSAQFKAEIARIKGSISEIDIQTINIKNEYLKEVVTELKDIQQAVADLKERLQASGDILERTVIIAPQSGKITGLQFHTIGGVIAPGAKILEIVPQNDKLIVEAKVQPKDIDIVREGLTAKVMLSAYKSRFVPRLEGEVVNLSADRFMDENTGLYYYNARIEIKEDEIKNLSEDVELYPGMPVETFIKTGDSTLINYLASPIIDSMRRSFKEQ